MCPYERLSGDLEGNVVINFVVIVLCYLTASSFFYYYYLLTELFLFEGQIYRARRDKERSSVRGFTLQMVATIGAGLL